MNINRLWYLIIGKLSNDVAKEQPEIIEKALRYMEESHQQNPIFPLTKEERNIN